MGLKWSKIAIILDIIAIWKYAKGKLRTKYYDRFDQFQARIDSIVSATDTDDKSIIDKLIGMKVQLFDDLVAINENTSVSGEQVGQLAA